MSRLIRMDRTGRTELAQWGADGPDGVVGARDDASFTAAREAFTTELANGYFAVVTGPDGAAEQVRELPPEAELVVLRRPIAGG